MFLSLCRYVEIHLLYVNVGVRVGKCVCTCKCWSVIKYVYVCVNRDMYAYENDMYMG